MRKAWIVAERAGLFALVLFLTSCSNVILNGPSAFQSATPGPSILYVASGAEPSAPQPNLTGYTISPNGLLTLLSCPTLSTANVLSVVGHGSLLFTTDGDAISVYSVDHSGCPQLKSVTNEDLNPDPYYHQGPSDLFLDAKNQGIYSFNYIPINSSEIVSYQLDPSTWELTQGSSFYVGFPGDPPKPDGILSFSNDGNYVLSTFWVPEAPSFIYVYRRSSDGTLTYQSTAMLPVTDPDFLFYPSGAAADAANHFVAPGHVRCFGGPGCSEGGPWRLAIYSMDSSGNMTTQSTVENMQVARSVGPSDQPIGYGFSPDGRYFAIGASIGIDVYSWDATSTTLARIGTIQSLPGCGVYQGCPPFTGFSWDGYDHLIAIWGADSSAQIEVFSVTASGIAAAPGSPYPFPSANMLTVVDTDR